MAKILKKFILGDMQAVYTISNSSRAALVLLPVGSDTDLLSEKNSSALEFSSLAHIHLSSHNEGIYSGCLKLSESVDNLKYVCQAVEENDEYIISGRFHNGRRQRKNTSFRQL